MIRHRELIVWLHTFSGKRKKRDRHHYSAGKGHFLESRVADNGTLEIRRYREASGSTAAECVLGRDYNSSEWAWTEYDVD